jgi:deazaflavin-dependent oxidoreductase (nitroreductase family)
MRRLRRWLFRIPLLLHRAGVRGLERVLGIDWMVLTTTGRRSGRPHVVMLDVVGHHAAGDVYYVQPADGRRADWVRNVAASPLVTAEVGGRRFQARVDDVTGSEGAEVVLHFIRSHPLYARVIVRFVRYVERVDVPDDELRRALATTPVFAIRALASPSAGRHGA